MKCIINKGIVTESGELLLELRVVTVGVLHEAVDDVVLHHKLLREGVAEGQDRRLARVRGQHGRRMLVTSRVHAAAHHRDLVNKLERVAILICGIRRKEAVVNTRER